MGSNVTVTDEKLSVFLKQISENVHAEAEWLDLLSQLEYVGCRKIIKAVDFGDVDFDVLRHISEEASHAFLLKSLVEKSGARGRSWRDSELGAMGWKYFQALDHSVARLQEDARSHYPAVSWVVERRVMQVYPQYAAVTKNPGVKRILNQIMAQEKRHGDIFAALPFPDWFRNRAVEVETGLWQEFLGGMSAWAAVRPTEFLH